MTSQELRQKFIEFFEAKGHILVPSSSLLPKDDPSVLLTTAGMQQFKPYFVGLKDPQVELGGRQAISIQKCFRTADIDDVGDDTHLTFFEMLGNFSFGDYFKTEAIQFAWEFLTTVAGISASCLSATYYNGNRPGTTADIEAKLALDKLDGLNQVSAQPDAENFWGPTGTEGPCGPTVEFHVNGVEVWNLVFNEFYCHPDGKLSPLPVRGVDTGMGLERLSVAVNQLPNIFATDVFKPLMDKLGSLTPRAQRIVADHIRGAVFLLGDHVRPSNKEQGYILRRILRRVLMHIHGSGVRLEDLINTVIDLFGPVYLDLTQNRESINQFARTEADKFSRTIDAGEKELAKLIANGTPRLSGAEAFKLFASYGLPIDFIKEKIPVDESEFDRAFVEHQSISRAGVEKKFGGHGLSAGAAIDPAEQIQITKLHTATHLLHAALREVLGAEVHQAGSDINPERTRFDFNFPRKLIPDEIQRIEAWVNDKISTGFSVKHETLPYAQAIAAGAVAFFKEKYPAQVDVYTIYNEDTGKVISQELCGGPHVTNSHDLGTFRITKEESSSAGVRRIKAVLE